MLIESRPKSRFIQKKHAAGKAEIGNSGRGKRCLTLNGLSDNRRYLVHIDENELYRLLMTIPGGEFLDNGRLSPEEAREWFRLSGKALGQNTPEKNSQKIS